MDIKAEMFAPAIIDPPTSICSIIRMACPHRTENHAPGKELALFALTMEVPDWRRFVMRDV